MNIHHLAVDDTYRAEFCFPFEIPGKEKVKDGQQHHQCADHFKM